MDSTGQGSETSPTSGRERALIDPRQFIEGRRTVLNYVPGNLCLSVRYDKTTLLARRQREVTSAPDSDRERLQAEFDALVATAAENMCAHVNQVLWGNLRRIDAPKPPVSGAGVGQLVDHDLFPAKTATSARSMLAPRTTDGATFNPLQPAPKRRPIALDWKDGSTSLLLCCAIDQTIGGGGTSRKPDPDLVRELVNAINRNLTDDEKRVGEGISVERAAPNWFSSAAANTCHGPGGQPRLARPAADPRFTFPYGSQVKTIVDGAQSPSPVNPVVVAVLDTCPTRQALSAARDRLKPVPTWPGWLDGAISDPNFTNQGWVPKPTNPSHAWIDELGLSEDEQTIRDLLIFDGSPIIGRTFGNPPDPDTFYRATDHGLFATGIIKSIAPNTEVHLIRVLDDFGVGDSMLLALTLQALGSKDWGNRPLVVNLSLVQDQPIGPNFLALWFARAFEKNLSNHLFTEGMPGGPLEDLKKLVDDVLASLNLPLRQTVDWLVEKLDRVLVVAAAGNDGNLRPSIGLSERVPRSPSDFKSVLAVAALKNVAAPQPADYTNTGDPSGELDNGVSIWGGNATVRDTDPDLLPRIDMTPLATGQPVDAIMGIFSSAELPMDGDPNATGWGYWAGTSFATPIVSAIAACVWTNVLNNQLVLPAPTGSEVMNYIRTKLTDSSLRGPTSLLQAPAIRVSQT